MVVCYAFEQRGRMFILGFATSCVLGSLYGFLQGAWPFGLVEAIWSLVALHAAGGWRRVKSRASLLSGVRRFAAHLNRRLIQALDLAEEDRPESTPRS